MRPKGLKAATTSASHSVGGVCRLSYCVEGDLPAQKWRSEKAGVGGSIPSLATISFSNLANQPEISHL
jgi:hypothetical protein